MIHAYKHVVLFSERPPAPEKFFKKSHAQAQDSKRFPEKSKKVYQMVYKVFKVSQVSQVSKRSIRFSKWFRPGCHSGRFRKFYEGVMETCGNPWKSVGIWIPVGKIRRAFEKS